MGIYGARRLPQPGCRLAHAFITGGRGFLARHITARLIEEGHRVTVLSRPGGSSRARAVIQRGVAVREGDLLRSKGQLIPAGADLVFHLAAKTSPSASIGEPVETFEVNAMGTARLLEEIRNRRLKVRRFVLASTSLVYAPSRGRPLRESDPVQPASPYAASKLAAETYALACDPLFDIPVSVVRVFNAYGPGQSGEFAVPSFITRCMGGGELRIGNPWPVRDFVYASDAADVFYRAAMSRKARGQVFNAGTGRGTSIERMARETLRATGSRSAPRPDPSLFRANDVRHLVADMSKARRLLGWRSRVTLRDGLERTAASMGAR